MGYKVLDQGYVADGGFEDVDDARDFAETLMTPDKDTSAIEIVDEKTDKLVCRVSKYHVIIEWEDVKE